MCGAQELNVLISNHLTMLFCEIFFAFLGLLTFIHGKCFWVLKTGNFDVNKEWQTAMMRNGKSLQVFLRCFTFTGEVMYSGLCNVFCLWTQLRSFASPDKRASRPALFWFFLKVTNSSTSNPFHPFNRLAYNQLASLVTPRH